MTRRLSYLQPHVATRLRLRGVALLLITLTLVAGSSGCGSDEPLTPAPTASATTSPTDHVTPQGPTDAAPEDTELCQVFRDFAEAQSQYVADPTAANTEALVTVGLTLAKLPQPADLSPDAYASLIDLVRGTLAPAVPAEDLPTVVGKPDEAAFSAYLDKECPA